MAGVFGQVEQEAYGNPTFFVLPPSMESHVHMEDDLFNSFELENLARETLKNFQDSNDVVSNIIQIYKTNLKILQDRIQNDEIECHYYLKKISLNEEDKGTIEFI